MVGPSLHPSLVLFVSSGALGILDRLNGLQALAQACTEDGISDETKRHIGQTIAHLSQQYSAQMQPLLSSLPPDQQSAVAAFGT